MKNGTQYLELILEIDTLRIKYEKEGKSENLNNFDEINAYVEDLEKFYLAYS